MNQNLPLDITAIAAVTQPVQTIFGVNQNLKNIETLLTISWSPRCKPHLPLARFSCPDRGEIPDAVVELAGKV